ncbi:MAG: hypothetical protein A2V69_03525 [Candidatus Portnoybacteria bacterium RBG_13_40_8]|uniref:Uncharacterized protein n=1 Tax=Candidatus Portnoybacteria bacterium RBG_13_40_8 TaxID=1801990 RepID=A0A1G2F2G5_9BACT|nr:MAG: hypothetical protein A2V69_03525 [Candidatus Portnoybacteria bacterium RBG_13_40_8]
MDTLLLFGGLTTIVAPILKIIWVIILIIAVFKVFSISREIEKIKAGIEELEKNLLDALKAIEKK